ncbi:MAG: hypothetical protein AVDCRST_MAG08-1993, partial [uncultured Acetobacteraceae bacterium]
GPESREHNHHATPRLHDDRKRLVRRLLPRRAVADRRALARALPAHARLLRRLRRRPVPYPRFGDAGAARRAARRRSGRLRGAL